MLAQFFSLLLFIVSLNTYAQDQTGSSKNSDVNAGLSLGTAQQFLFDYSKNANWNYNDVYCRLGTTAGISVAFGLVGSIIAGLFCQNQASVNECNSHCNNKYDCEQACTTQYGIKTPHNPVCITGATFVSEFFMAWILFGLSKPITSGINYIVDKRNSSLQELLRKTFKRGLPNECILADDDFDVQLLGLKLLVVSSPLLKELSPGQALNIAERNFSLVIQRGEGAFRQDAWEQIDNIRKLLEMDAKELSTTLGAAKNIFTREPILWQTLVRLLPDEIVGDNDVRKSLSFLLKSILNEKSDKSWDDVIDQVRQGTRLNAFILQELIVDDLDSDKKIELTCGDDTYLLSESKLKETSEYFSRGLSSNWSQKPLDQNPENKEKLKILSDVVHGKLHLSVANIWQILDAATYFSMPKTLEQCDRFLRDSWPSHHHNIITTWLKYDKESEGLKNNLFSTYWAFGKKYSLIELKRYLALELILKLNTVDDNPKYFNDLLPILDDDLSRVLVDQSIESLSNQLQKPRFLKWLFEHGWKNSVIKNIITQFIKQKKHNPVIKRAWVVIPSELSDAAIEKVDNEEQKLIEYESEDDDE